MKDFHKKESPFQGITGFAGGATGLRMFSAALKTYVDDVFHTHLYTGTGSSRSITTGIDMTEGGLVWHKPRGAGDPHWLFDTVRGTTKVISSNSTDAESTEADTITAFNNNGYTLGASAELNPNNTVKQASWTFRKAKGFFDVVTYTGNGTAGRTVSHNLGSIPGCIMVKRTDTSGFPWRVYHRGVAWEDPQDYGMRLESTDPRENEHGYWNDTAPTSSVFTLGSHASVNVNGGNFIAYVFAGGESSASTATSVYTESTGYLGLDESTDFDLGTSDFTIEAWVRPRTGDRSGNTFNILSFGYPFNLSYVADGSRANSGKFIYSGSTSNASDDGTFGGNTGANSVEQNQWNHVALTRSGSTFKFFLNGTLKHTSTSSSSFGTNTVHGCKIGYGTPAGTQYFQGDVSNLRYVLGTALYTDSFKVPTEPLSNVTNTKLLCCQGSATDSATVSPGSITAYNSPSWKAYSPFDDPDGFKFGAEGDQNIIKIGNYIGNGNTNGPDINLGWEPDWILIKRANVADNWFLVDSMRGIVQGGNDAELRPDETDAEYLSNRIDLTSTGFKFPESDNIINGSGDIYAYIAIRRPDGYVGKPAEAGTDVFAMDYGNASTTIPAFDSNFPVDFGLQKTPTTATDWAAVTRLMGPKELNTNDTSAEASGSAYVWDSNVGYTAASWADSGMLSWMWKRHSGFDVITTDIPLTAGDTISHNLGVVPEMIIGKPRDSSYAGEAWNVYHKGLNGGTNPEQYRIRLNSTDAQASDSAQSFYDTAPTATHFRIGANYSSDRNPLFLLFASVDGISKCGYYTGDGSNDGSKVITTGFQPRFIMIKSTSNAEVWVVLDTVRGIQNGANDQQLYLNSTDAQVAGTGVDLSATGFSLRQASGEFNANGYNYIYYAHA